METMQLNYHKVAEEKGVFIISACGFDSVPVDLGVIYFQKNFPGTFFIIIDITTNYTPSHFS